MCGLIWSGPRRPPGRTVWNRIIASPRTHDHRANWPELIDTCLSNTGTIEMVGGAPQPAELGLTPVKDPFDPIAVSTMNAKLNGKGQFLDSLPICRFCMPDFKTPIEALNIITGWSFDIPEAMDAGRRIINQFRAFNFRHGLKKEMEARRPCVMAPLLWMVLHRGNPSVPSGNRCGATIINKWDGMPETGKPLPETLKNLGLDYLIPDLQG